MQSRHKKIIRTYLADELGLPVVIKNVPIIESDGHEVVDIDYATISAELFAALITKPTPLTGAEVRFMRLFMGLTLEKLASSLHVRHPTILSWERCGNEHTKMAECAEAMLRLFAATQVIKDKKLISAILDSFFRGSSQVDHQKVATVIKIGGEAPKVCFSDREDDLRLVEGACIG